MFDLFFHIDISMTTHAKPISDTAYWRFIQASFSLYNTDMTILIPDSRAIYKQLFLILAFLSSASAMGSTAVTPPYLLWMVLFLCWASSSLVVPLNLQRVQWYAVWRTVMVVPP
eukprot:GFUD01089620.1.p1 GENE.GFUD01089620.1~~GFUD01089620.1.p1  ORF type:complete len:114 (+),score=15.35 GFUD01089620.1:267-608(+)